LVRRKLPKLRRHGKRAFNGIAHYRLRVDSICRGGCAVRRPNTIQEKLRGVRIDQGMHVECDADRTACSAMPWNAASRSSVNTRRMCRQVLGTSPSSRAMACTPSGALPRPSKRRMALPRDSAGTGRTRTGFAAAASALAAPALIRASADPRQR
jgi:hypothetical protein